MPPPAVAASFCAAEQVHAWPAVVAAHRLCVVAAACRVVVLARAFRAHGELAHAGALPVVRQGAQDGQARAAAGAVYEGMQVPAVRWVKQLPLAVVADGDVRRDEDRAPRVLALLDRKAVVRAGLGCRHVHHLHLDDIGPLGRLRTHQPAEVIQLTGRALGENLHVGALVADGARDARPGGVPRDGGAHAHALHNAVAA